MATYRGILRYIGNALDINAVSTFSHPLYISFATGEQAGERTETGVGGHRPSKERGWSSTRSKKNVQYGRATGPLPGRSLLRAGG